MQYLVLSVLPAPDSPDITMACFPSPQTRLWYALPAMEYICGVPLKLPVSTASRMLAKV